MRNNVKQQRQVSRGLLKKRLGARIKVQSYTVFSVVVERAQFKHDAARRVHENLYPFKKYLDTCIFVTIALLAIGPNQAVVS